MSEQSTSAAVTWLDRLKGLPRNTIILISGISAGIVFIFMMCCCGSIFWMAPGISPVSSGFNQNDFEATKAWARHKAAKINSIQNHIASADAIKEFNDFGLKQVGKKVRWKLPVFTITNEYVTIYGGGVDVANITSATMMRTANNGIST
jgi:hypothetical protein